MEIVQWDSSLETGIESIDIQHEELLRIINDLHNGIDKECEDFPLAHIFDSLGKYVRYHFSHEEALLAKCGYEDLEDHKARHQMFVDQIASFNFGQADENGQIRREMLAFLQDWLVFHITYDDMRCVPCLKAKNLK